MGGELKVLGAVRLIDSDGSVVELRGASQRRLLCALAASSGATVRAESLCEILDTTTPALRTTVSRLRARTGDGVLETDGAGYRLVAELDADVFEDLIATVGSPAGRLATLEQALDLWDGEAFDEFSHEPWAEISAARLNELRTVARNDRAELLISQGRAGEAVAALEALVAANPHLDRTQGLLIQALAAAGRQADALRHFQAYRALLVEESGTEPSSAVQEIERRVASGTSDEAAEALRQAVASGRVTIEDDATSAPASAVSDPSETNPPTTLPSGVLTFLFTDIEGSTRRWEQAPADMRDALAQHDRLLKQAIVDHSGVLFKHTGDGVGAVFVSPGDGVNAAVAMQRALQAASWTRDDRLKIRIGMHMGEASPTGDDYYGGPINRAARVMDIANGDQIVVSSALHTFLRELDVHVSALGDHLLKGIGTESIYHVTAEGLEVDGRPLRSPVSGPKRLPVPPDRLIGRADDVAQLSALTEQHQCVTLLGPGGVGKTRLALAVGDAIAGRFTEGGVFCDLTALGDGDALADAVAEALGARAQPGMSLPESIVDFLESRNMLLVLDNCEHLATSVRSLTRDILTRTDCRIIATSREPIGVPAEQLFGVQPLVEIADSVELFIERATERTHSFAPTEEDLAAITDICARLDGIPLAIELAAAWVRVLAPAQILERLDDRFGFLRGGRPGGRHETLRDTILWSYEQLDDQQSRMFNRLSVFAGGFSLDAVEAVCVDDAHIDALDVLQLLMALVDKSMVVAVRSAGHVRFTMLGTLRQFAQEQLDSSADSAHYRQRHADYFGDFAVVEAAMLISDKEVEVWELLDREWANVRAAFESMIAAGDFEAATTLVLELGWYASLSMRFELYAWVDELAANLDDLAPDQASGLCGLQALAAYFTVDAASGDYANRGLELDASDPYGYCRVALSAISLNNDLSADLSATHTTDWLDSLTDTSPLASVMWAHGMRAFHLCVNEPSPKAADQAETLRAIAETTGSATAAGVAHWASGMVASFGGLDGALAEWRTGMDVIRSLAPVHLVYDLIIGLVLHFTVSRGELGDVIDSALGALEQANDNHYHAGTSHLFGVTAIVLCRCDRAETAAQLLGAMVANGHVPRENATVAVDRALGDGVDAAKGLGTMMTINEAAALAMTSLREAQAEHRVA